MESIMKKIILATLMSASFLFASSDDSVTINATMQLMNSGVDSIQEGFFYSDKQKILNGIEMIENANNIFGKIDVKDFVHKKNISVQVVNNLSDHMGEHLQDMKKAVDANNYNDTTKSFGEMINNCVACHIAIRKW